MPEFKNPQTSDQYFSKLAYQLPERLVYFAAIRLAAAATVGKYGNTEVPNLKFMDAIQRWEERHGHTK